MVSKIPFIYYYYIVYKYTIAREKGKIMPVVNPFAGADYEAGVNQSTVEGSVTQGFSSASTAFGSGQVPISTSGLYQQSGGGSVKRILGSGSKTAFDLLDPKNARNSISGLFPGGMSSATKVAPTIGFQGASAEGGATAANEDDWRVRVSLNPGAKIFYQDPMLLPNSLLQPLTKTNGIIFPYTPTVSMTHSAQYSTQQLTHSNYPAHFFNYSEVSDITVSGDFTVQNPSDGQYLMAVIYFLRSATKMFFGTGDNVGMPPPVVYLDGYGSHYLPHVPCLLASFTHTMPADVDYVQVPVTRSELDSSPIEPNRAVQLNEEEQKYVPSLLRSETQATTDSTKATMKNSRKKDITTTTRLPTFSTINITLRPVYSRKSLHDRFDLNKFAQGELLANKDTGAGGFI